MKVVPPANGSEKQKECSPLIVPTVDPACYGDLFHQADWVVTHRPWENLPNRFLFEQRDSTGFVWKASLGSNPGLAVFRLTRKDDEDSALSERLEVRFVSSDFLQGHDYELNVRFAPESWDKEEFDVIVLRAFDSLGGQLHPGEKEVVILRDALRTLRREWEASSQE